MNSRDSFRMNLNSGVLFRRNYRKVSVAWSMGEFKEAGECVG